MSIMMYQTRSLSRSRLFVWVCAAANVAACAGGTAQPASKPVAAVPTPVAKPTLASGKYDNTAVATELTSALSKERARDLDGARSDYQAALKVDPANVDATIGLARVLTAQGKFELADKLLDTARKANGDKPELLLAQAQVARLSKKSDKAVELARKVLLKDQGNADALNFIALVYAEQGKLDLAEVYAINAQKFAPKSAQIMTTIGFISMQRGDKARALAQFQKATEGEGNTQAAYANIGFLALENRDYALAKTSLDKAYEQGRVSKDVSAGRCYSREGLREGKEAAACFSELIARLGPSDADAASYTFTLGSIQQNLNRDNDAALAAYKKYVELKGNQLAKNDRVFDLMKGLEAKNLEQKKAATPAPEQAPAAAPAPAEVPEQPAAGAPTATPKKSGPKSHRAETTRPKVGRG